VRDVFFSGATSLPSSALISQSPDTTETTLVLIGSSARGASVPDGLLKDMIQQTSSREAWEAFSHLGPSECLWVLENHPEKLLVIAEAALNLVPQKAIPLLLHGAIGDNRPLHSNPHHPLRQIEDWVRSGKPGSGSAVSRREALVDSALSWFSESGNSHITLHALSFALSPGFADNEASTGSTLTFTFHYGLVTPDQMSIVQGFWPRVRDFLSKASIRDWGPVFDIMQEWLYPNRVARNIPAEVRNSMQEFAIEMAKDTISTNAEHPGVLSRLARIFKQSEIQLNISLNPEFDILYPVKDWGPNWEESQPQQQFAADGLADTWSTDDPEKVAKLLVHYESEAQSAQITWPRWSPYVCERIAGTLQRPSTWARSLIKQGSNSELVIPFLKAAASTNDPEFPGLLKECLKVPALQFAAVSCGLSSESLPTDVLSDILSILDDRFSMWVSTACLRSEIPERHVAILLTHPVRAIAAAAAIGEWQSTPEGSVRESLRDVWRRAVVGCLQDDYGGEQIFRRDPSIAFDWLELRMKESRNSSYRGDILLNTALQVIGLEQRRSLLSHVGDSFWNSEVIHGIVDDSLEAYRDLLHDQRLKRFHLAPLNGRPSGVWIDKALVALDAGYSPDSVSQAVYGHSWSWSGNESNYWEEWARSFERLLAHGDPRIREVGRIGRDQALEQRDRDLKNERHQDIYGR
jgi:hypothetical protein